MNGLSLLQTLSVSGGGQPSSVTFYNETDLFVTHFTVGVYRYTQNGVNIF
jgi:hypothetical protein